MLAWFHRHLGRRSRGGMGAVLGGLDEVFHPEAVHGREDVDRQHSMVVPLPSPGDTMLDDGVAVIEWSRPEEDDG